MVYEIQPEAVFLSAVQKDFFLFLSVIVSQLHIFQICFQLCFFEILEWSLSLSTAVYSFMILHITKDKGNHSYYLNSLGKGLEVSRFSR